MLRRAASLQGPVEANLRTYGAVRGLIFGSWGEASTKVNLLAAAAVAPGPCQGKKERQMRRQAALDGQSSAGASSQPARTQGCCWTAWCLQAVVLVLQHTGVLMRA